ncbi:unnamed protein product [Cyberlindnera jadinii]|uniref:Peptidase A1 domain-containing protein n=1 Tax=Cyberlindnera jadinii (strain ATCC 18201 / CBS 1600 / BCRC 20928 / JCM 3617 / NBRC 0987 / NRRL Y-1542) TaxID=983966 RepID=A0A0H5BYH7_CYBJN|nr:unnamed protein product [Cyberlindnera jadinii]
MKLSNLIIGSTFAALACSNAVPMKFDALRGNDPHSAKKVPKLSKRGDSTVYADMFYEGGVIFASRMVVNGTEVFARLDTGSSDFWVYAPNNPYCSSNGGGEIAFPAASTTLSVSSEAATIDCEARGVLNIDVEVLEGDHPTFLIGYADTTVAAGVYLDGVVTFGNATLNDFTFGVANISNSTPICGLSFEHTESTGYIYQNLPSALKQTGLIKRTAFSMWLDGENAEGYILFGGIDHSKYDGELVTLPLIAGQNMSQPSTFNVNLNSIVIYDGESEVEVLSNTTSVLFDSGTSEVYLPPNAVENIAEALKATYSDSWGQYLVRCPEQSTNITFGFNFDGLKVDIPLETFLVATDSSHKECALNIFAGTKGVNYILGDVFLQEVYVVFDLEGLQLRVAPVNNNNDTAEIEVLEAAKTPSGGFNNETLTATVSWNGLLTTVALQETTDSLSEAPTSSYGLSTSMTASESSSTTKSKNIAVQMVSTCTLSSLIAFVVMML